MIRHPPIGGGGPGIRSLIGKSRFLPLLAFQCSTSRFLRNASPKAISERTSYSQVRLAFHSNPQLIRWRCTTNRFGPPGRPLPPPPPPPGRGPPPPRRCPSPPPPP